MKIFRGRSQLGYQNRPFLVVSAAIVLLAIIGFVGSDFYSALGRARALYAVGVLGESIQGDVAYYLQESRRTVTYALTTKDPNAQLPFIDQARSADQAVDRLISSLSKLDFDDKTRAALKQFVASRPDYLAARDEIISLILTDHNDQALAIDLTRSTPAFNRAVERLRQMKTSLDRYSASLSNAVLRALYRTLAEFVVLLATTFLFIAAVASNFQKRRALEALGIVNQELQIARAAAEQAGKEMRVMLNNLEEGLVTINLDGRMLGAPSRAFEQWFGTPVAGDELATWIGQNDASFGDWFDLALESLKEGILPAEVPLSQLPALLKNGDKTYSVRYQLITNANDSADQVSDKGHALPRAHSVMNETVPEKILVIITDITDILTRDAAERHQGELLQLFQHMMRDRAAFLEFLREADDIMSSLKGGRYDGLDHLKRLVHTLKGNSAIFGMRYVSGICHELENKIAEQGEAPTSIEMAVLDQVWDRIRSDIQKLVGGTHQSRIEIDDHDYEVVLKALHDGIDVNTVGRMIESWRLEPTEKRLLTVEQQIRGIAERIGKTNLSVFVEPNALRFNSERFAPFWSAFIHVLRNAVDHGIEDREERQKAGKPAQSVIRVATSMDRDRFVITVDDDGPGVDWERLRTKAAELGVPASALKEPLDLICLPRLSSKDTITELSGRGIGLGIVVDACKALGGTVDVQSQQGIGTRIEFAFPKSQGIYEGHVAVLEAASILVAR